MCGVRYRGVLSEARTKQQAEQAESKIKQEIFEGRFGKLDLSSEKLADFIENVCAWSKANKRSWKHHEFRARTIRGILAAKRFARFRLSWLRNPYVTDARRSTARPTVRSLAAVNLELPLLSKIFNLAIDYKVTDTTPCIKVKKYTLDNKRYHYLMPEEEPALMAALEGPRAPL